MNFFSATEEVFLYLPLSVLEEHFILNNGRILPKITFGTSQFETFENFYNAVDIALDVGYRAFDCSPSLFGEENLGRALEELLPKYNVQRSDIIISTKILPKDYGMDSTTEAFWHSCEKLKTDYIDLFMMQWPGGHNLDPDDDKSQDLREDTWKEIVNLYSQGSIKSPGVCHFTCRHLEHILEISKTIPAVVQAEFHPRFPQFELLDFCKENNIVLQASSFIETFHPLLLNEDAVKRVAKEIKITTTQVLLKWIINKNVGVICQSNKAKKIKQNFEIFDFVLDKPAMDLINSVDVRQKYLPNPIIVP